MTTENWNKKVHKHGSWQELVPGVWQITGTLGKGAMTRNMVAARLPSGTLILHSVIALNEQEMTKLLSFGEPEYMIVPSPFHRLDAPVYLQRFPNLKALCPHVAQTKVSQKVTISGLCEEVLPKIGVKHWSIPGVKNTELAYEFGESKKALIFCDALMNLPDLPGFDGKLMGWLGSTGFFGMTRIGRVFLLKNRTAFSDWLNQMSQRQDLGALSVAHGASLANDLANKLKQAADRLR